MVSSQPTHIAAAEFAVFGHGLRLGKALKTNLYSGSELFVCSRNIPAMSYVQQFGAMATSGLLRHHALKYARI